MRHIAFAAAVIVVTAGSAHAASVTGRVTFISTDGSHLMLDNSEMYAIGPDVPRSGATVADRVTANYQTRAGERAITRLTLNPLKPSSAQS